MPRRYTQTKNKPRTLRTLTDFKPNEFEALLPSFSAAWDSFVEDTYLAARYGLSGLLARGRHCITAQEEA
ncbi:MAG: hypothetical protein AAF703_13495 [Cyanobacteria bacterium P01_D01_bin.105]